MPADIFSKIGRNNAGREARDFSEYACLSACASRRYNFAKNEDDSIRPAFFRDTDRIIHSQAYSRYIDKTQVFYLFENDHITHRVLHVQFVAKIGRVIGRSLKLNEDLIEAISLGHDIGHVPYGHDGEKIINEICEKHRIGAFCHNAQSVRFLYEIEKNGLGLNLSLQVLDGILAHNGEIFGRRYLPHYAKTWEDFESEYRNSLKQVNYSKKIFPMTLEGCVARISDIIAYIGRDIEDAITLRLIKRSGIPATVRRVLGQSNRKIINTLVLDLIKNSYGKPHLEFSGRIFKALKELREFNYKNIYFNPAIKTNRPKISNMFVQLFNQYHHELISKKAGSFIYRYYERMDKRYRKATDKKRAVIDFIAGMTDNFFNNQFKTSFVPQSYGYIFNQNT